MRQEHSWDVSAGFKGRGSICSAIAAAWVLFFLLFGSNAFADSLKPSPVSAPPKPDSNVPVFLQRETMLPSFELLEYPVRWGRQQIFTVDSTRFGTGKVMILFFNPAGKVSRGEVKRLNKISSTLLDTYRYTVLLVAVNGVTRIDSGYAVTHAMDSVTESASRWDSLFQRNLKSFEAEVKPVYPLYFLKEPIRAQIRSLPFAALIKSPWMVDLMPWVDMGGSSLMSDESALKLLFKMAESFMNDYHGQKSDEERR